MPHSRYEIYVQLQTVLAGNRVEDSLAATMDSLATIAAASFATVEEIDSFIDTAAEDMKRHVRANWVATREHRAALLAGNRIGQA